MNAWMKASALTGLGIWLAACGGGELDWWGCRSDADCKHGRICVDGSCQDDGQACQADEDCPIGQHCYDLRCTVCDADADGALGRQCNGPDCDDADPAVRPGARELCGDGRDNDCDGATDPAQLCDPKCAGIECPEGFACDPQTGLCVPLCEPVCAGLQCGPDGCGGSCGSCPPGQICNRSGRCVTACEDRCERGTLACVGNGVVRCTDTDGDGCVEWSQPEACPAGQTCSDGRCAACVPNCAGRECGPDGCEGTCGTCPRPLFCEAGKCVDQCYDECWWDESMCISDREVVTCGEYDGDPCLEFGPPQPCPDGCDWATGRCGGSCWDDCFWGESWCWSEWEAIECGQWDNDPCLEFGPPLPCPEGFCDWETGRCGGGCWDECEWWGQSICWDGFSYAECGDFNGDGCLEFSDPIRCPSGRRCDFSTGRCRGGGCTDECGWGESFCVDDWAYVECGEWDGDPCLEFGPPLECPPDAPCDWNTGQCGNCWDECWWSERYCWDDSSYVQCGQYDPDQCLEFGPPIRCPAGTPCDWQTGNCQNQGGRPGAGQPCGLWDGCPADFNAAWTCVEYPAATDGFCSFPCQGDDDCAIDFPAGCCRQLTPGYSVCLSDADLCQVQGAGYLEWCIWSSNQTCLPDMFCIEDYIGQENACLFTCDRAMGICPLGGSCLPIEDGSATGICMPSGDGQFGDPCSLDDGCVVGLLCTPLDAQHPGYCNTMCSNFLPCPNGFDCVLDDGAGGRWCAELCNSQADCARLGAWECVFNWDPGTGVCLPLPVP